jgi:lysophospholipase L1-like esterase
MKTTIQVNPALTRGVLAIAGIYSFIAGCAPEHPQEAVGTDAALLGSALSAAGPFTHYVAMGDSYSAGTGLVDQAGACTSSTGAWPYQVAPLINELAGAPPSTAAPEIVFRACSGAKAENITGPYPERQQAPQIDALSMSGLPSTTLITLTVGGNDAGAGDFGVCLLAAMFDPTTAEATCKQIAESITNRINTVVASKLQSTFTAISDAAPAGATIVAVGYPHLMSSANNAACTNAGFATGIPTSVRTLFNNGIDSLNRAIDSAARDAGIQSITSEIVTAFQGHEICSEQEWFVALSDPLLRTPTGAISEAGGHPNEAGYEAYTNAMLQALASRVRITTVDMPDLPVPGSEEQPPTIPPTPDTESTGEEEPWEGEEEPWGDEEGGEEEVP